MYGYRCLGFTVGFRYMALCRDELDSLKLAVGAIG